MRIAVIGGGISGIVAAHRLQSRFDVTLFERRSRLGGHANPVRVQEQKTQENPHFLNRTVDLDTGFVIFNHRSYPTFTRFLSELGTEFGILDSKMTFGFFHKNVDLEFSTASLSTFFPSFRNIPRLDVYLILRDILRFHRDGPKALQATVPVATTIDEYLRRYSDSFRHYFALPMISLIWSVPPSSAGHLPAATFINFLDHHGHFGKLSERKWLSFKLSSSEYLNAFQSAFKGKIALNTEVLRVDQKGAGVLVHTQGSEPLSFDGAIVALHADEAFRVLERPGPDHQELLAPWKYHESEAFLHHDSSVLSTNRRLWSCWNTTTTDQGSFMSYHLNQLHELNGGCDYFLTMNPLLPIDHAKVLESFKYRHLLLDQAAIARQSQLPRLNRKGLIKFCGSYFGYGFHEDGALSGLNAATSLSEEFN